MSENVVEIKGVAQFEAEKEKCVGFLLDFYAEWCPPCKKLGETIAADIGTSNGWKVFKVNVDEDENQEIAQNHGVQGIPQVNLYIDKANVDKFVGNNQTKLKDFMSRAAEKFN